MIKTDCAVREQLIGQTREIQSLEERMERQKMESENTIQELQEIIRSKESRLNRVQRESTEELDKYRGILSNLNEQLKEKEQTI